MEPRRHGERAMSSNEFQSALYPTQARMLDAIAEQWITATGANATSDVLRSLSVMSDAELAAEAIEGWGLDQPAERYHATREDGDIEQRSHMQAMDYTAVDLERAFARLRAEVTIPRSSIRALRTEAGEHGDLAQVEICDRALGGGIDAIRECARVIADGRG